MHYLVPSTVYIDVTDFAETYQKLELEKKKARIHRQTHAGPVIRYHSVTVPLVEEVADAEINVEGEALDRSEHVHCSVCLIVKHVNIKLL